MKKNFYANAFLITVLAANAIFFSFNAFRIFNLFDMGCMMDGAWRIFCGQEPYKDFIFITGPLHLYFMAGLFWIFGFGKTAIWTYLVLTHSVVIIITFLIGRKYLSLLFLCLATILSVTCFNWPFSHPWYDQLAHLFGITGVGLLVLSGPLNTPKKTFLISMALGALALLAFMSKTNIGTAYLMAFFATFLILPLRRQSLPGYMLGVLSGIIVVLALFIHSPMAYLDQTLITWGQEQSSRRFGELLINPNWLYNHHYWLIAILVLLNRPWQKCKETQKRLVVFLSLVFVAIISNLTSSSQHEANAPLMGIFMALAFSLIPKDTSSPKLRRITLAIFIMISVSFAAINTKYGMEIKIWAHSGEKTALKNGPLKGWLFKKEDGESLDGIIEYVNKNVPKEDSLLVLTDLQILYASTGRESFKGIPHNFLPGDLPAQGKQLNTVRNNILNNLPEWIVTHHRETSFVTPLLHYLDITEVLNREYRPVYTRHNYVILRHKQSS